MAQVPVAFVLNLLPKIYTAIAGRHIRTHADPRGLLDSVSKSELNGKRKGRIERAEYAVANGFETIGLYAACVVASNFPGVNARVANILSIVYLITRVMYMFVYIILQDNPRWAPVRTVCWAAGIGVMMGMLTLARNGANWQQEAVV
jgi:uncharacterized MAPEG superfamily protein